MDIAPPTSNVKDLVNIVIDSASYVKNLLGEDYQKFATKYNFALNEYIEAKSNMLSRAKLAFFSSQVVALEDIYVPHNINFSSLYKQDEFLDVVKENKRFIVSATAGSGKSLFLRSLFINIVKEKQPLIPLFLELRNLNDSEDSILNTLVQDISRFNSSFEKNNLEYLLNREGTVLFLDGFDEISHENKKKYIREINDISERFSNLMFIVSSRPEYGLFQEWTLFNVADLEPLTLEQAIKLVTKLDYENEIKTRFIKDLKQKIFKKHTQFASNPLLLTIMLVTYEQFGDIPEKVHIFYDFAYQTLFHKHDSSKQGYKRKSLTQLDINDFRKVFSLFCLITYSKQAFQFKEADLEHYLQKSLEHYSHDIQSDLLKLELLSNIPLLMQDGIDFCFSHRSFQEYFAAFYLANNPQLPYEIFEVIGERYHADDLINMLFSMNQDVLEEKWILPKIEKLLDAEPSLDSDLDKIKHLSVFFGGIDLLNEPEDNFEKHVGVSFGENQYFVQYLISKYHLNQYHKVLTEKISWSCRYQF